MINDFDMVGSEKEAAYGGGSWNSFFQDNNETRAACKCRPAGLVQGALRAVVEQLLEQQNIDVGLLAP